MKKKKPIKYIVERLKLIRVPTCPNRVAKVGIYCGEFGTLIEAQMQVMCLPAKHPAEGLDCGTRIRFVYDDESISYPPRED